ncbi:MAG TPA: peptidoglycan DD-metalloendopeptidase family protein [Rhodocyclaceae bacterium]|nr:peptidoglycan DD-metalloendopeptidase family protein [Rhodocyclaceae bacterium]
MLRRLILAALLAAATSSQAQSDSRTEKRGELRDLQGRIESLRKDLAKSEENRSEAADNLRETETAISNSNRRLRELGDNRAELKRELADLETQSQKLERQISAQQAHISGLLYRQHLRGDADALKLLLSGHDPNETARDYHYLTLLSKAKTELVGDLRNSLAEKQKLADAVRDRNEQLAENEKKQQEQRQSLLAQQKQRQVVLASIAGKIKNQRREIETLKLNEKRLSKLIEGLARIVAKAPRKRSEAAPKTNSGSGPSTPSIRNEREPDSGLSGEFAALRGKLRLPVRGEINNRFGSPRADGGTTWKGVFVRANEGAEVKSVAPGQVVYADWLRGFGNLLIIDHGDGYLTIYGNNESLYRQTGDKVKSGDVVASVGNSGGNPESGLYFELRHQGQVLDPLKWVNLR